MAMPAARPIYQRFTAGSSRLEVTSQPAALSQWTARPIAQDLTFKLWLQAADAASLSGTEAEGSVTAAHATDSDLDGDVDLDADVTEADVTEGLTLVAEGDRITLQTLTQYIQQKTHSSLALVALKRDRAPTPPAPPPFLRLNAPLSYLQLCDLNTVLSQYEQSATVLPVDLAVEDLAADLETLAAASRTQAAGNVISFDARRKSSSRSGRQSASVIAAKKRKRLVWASSAAAAVFAVGLTSTLWSRDPSLQQSALESAAPEQDIDRSQLEGAAPLADQAAVDDDTAEDAASADIQTDGSQITARSNAQTNAPSVGSVPALSGSSDTETPSVERPAANAPASLPSASASSAATQPRTPGAQGDENRSAISNGSLSNGAGASDADSTNSSDLPGSGRSVPAEATASESEESRFIPPASPAPTRPGGASRGTASSAPSPPVARPEVQPEVQLERRAAAQTEAEALPPAAVFERAPATDNAPSASGAERAVLESLAQRQQEILSENADVGDLLTASPEVASTVTNTILQVQTYFQQRWRVSEVTDINESLVYRLQLSATGEVVSFAALSETAQTYRDRILPTDNPPSFPANATTTADLPSQGTALRVVFSTDGMVQVSLF